MAGLGGTFPPAHGFNGSNWPLITVWLLVRVRPGHQAENTNKNNNLNHQFASIFLRKFSRLVENTRKKLAPAVQFVGIFVGIGKLNDRDEFRYSEQRN